MKLDQVQISQFRNIDSLVFSPNCRMNILIGENGSGKSSILEALHYLGFARSFRTLKHRNVIKQGADSFTVFSTASDSKQEYKLAISRKQNDTCVVNINGDKTLKATTLVSHLPIQIFTPQSADHLLGAPKQRRRYLDWLLFHVKQSFNADSSVFAKCLKQLNAVYRTKQNLDANEYWLQTFADYGERLSIYRQNIIDSGLKELIKDNLTLFLPEFSFEISYYRGWDKDTSLYDVLKSNKQKDYKNGFVSAGPHKSDVRIKVQGVMAQEVLSRGQLRMLVAAMQLAQTQYLESKTGKTSIFLLDDIGAELDKHKRDVFVSRLNDSKAQLFITAIDIAQLEFLEDYNEKTVFHVKHGQLIEES